MKKLLLIAVLLAVPLVTSAQTMNADVLASLLKQLQTLQQMVLTLQAQLNSLTSNSTVSGSTSNLGNTNPNIIGVGYNQYQVDPRWASLPSYSIPQVNNSLNGIAGGAYGGVQLASLGTRTSAPALGSNNSGCSLREGWTIPMIKSQYGSNFVQYACGSISKELFLFSIDYCTNATDCYHHDYTGQYKIPRETLEKAVGAVPTINFDPVTVDPFDSRLFTPFYRSNAKCMALRNHNGELDMYEAQCGTRTGQGSYQTDTYDPTSSRTGQTTSTTQSTAHYSINQLKAMGTRTSAAPLGSNGYCTISTSGEAQNWGKDPSFINSSCRMYGLGYQTWLYSIRYKYDNKCYLHDYTGQYEVGCDMLGNPPTISAIPTNYDGMNREYFNSGFQAQCWALRNHGGQLGGYDAGCGTSTGY